MSRSSKTSRRFLNPRALVLLALVLGRLALATEILQNWRTDYTCDFAGIDSVIYAKGRYVAFGEYSDWGAILTSEDGLSWTVRAGAAGAQSVVSWSRGMCFAGNLFFALGNNYASGVSSNGIDWVTFSLGGSPGGVAFSGSRYAVAVGSAYQILTSTNGINWTPQSPPAPYGGCLNDIAFGAGKFVALGSPFGSTDDSGHTYTASSLGVTWTQRTIPRGGLYISFYKGVFIVPLSAGTNLLSADGVNWAALPSGITNRLRKVMFYNGIFMARADTRWLATSIDGTNWIRYASALPDGSPDPSDSEGGGEPNVATDGNRLVVGRRLFGSPHMTGLIASCDDLINLQISPSAGLAISGLEGRSNRIEYANSLSTTSDWQVLTNIRLQYQPASISDPSAQTTPQRFYRAVLLP